MNAIQLIKLLTKQMDKQLHYGMNTKLRNKVAQPLADDLNTMVHNEFRLERELRNFGNDIVRKTKNT